MILLKLGIVSLAVSVAVGEWIRQYRVKRDRKWRSKEGNGTTGAELARSILSAKRIDDVEVVESRHFLTNHFLPEEKVVRLAPENFHGKTIAALGMAAHVVGHALQAEEGHRPLRWRNEAIRFTVWGSAAAVMGVIPLMPFRPSLALAILGITWAFLRIQNLFTLPVEMDASGRAKDVIHRARLLKGKVREGTEEMLEIATLDRVSALLDLWTYTISAIFQWRKK